MVAAAGEVLKGLARGAFDSTIATHNPKGDIRAAETNAAHRALVDLERACDVRIVTQNVDDLRERAGKARRIVVNPETSAATTGPDFEVVAEPATVGVPKVVADLLMPART